MIAYNNILRAATIDSEDTAAGYPFANALTGRTSEQAGFTSGATRAVDFDNGSAIAVAALCLAYHNLGTVGATLTLSGSSDDASYSTLISQAFSDDNVAFLTFAEASYRYLRLEVSGHSGTAYIGDFFVGPTLGLPYGPDVGWTQPSQADDDEIIANVTGSGAIAGVSVITKPKRTQIQLRNFEKSWFDSNWTPLISTLKRYPGYYLWKSTERAMYFVLTGKAAGPSFTSPTRQSTSLDVIGLV